LDARASLFAVDGCTDLDAVFFSYMESEDEGRDIVILAISFFKSWQAMALCRTARDRRRSKTCQK
jgi:hypothetical protein